MRRIVSSTWPVLVITILFVALYIGPFRDNFGLFREATEYPELMVPPERPPHMVLSTRKVPFQDQRGVLAVFDWLIEGRAVRSQSMPYEWPSPALLSNSSPFAARQSDSVTIRFESESTPATIQIRGYDSLNLDTVPQGEPNLVKIWEHPRIFKSLRDPRS